MTGVRPVGVLDSVGWWSEIKLDVISKYANAYSKIMAAQRKRRFHHVYVDAFAGAGMHISKKTGGVIRGSPLNALNVTPPFGEYYFIEIKPRKLRVLRTLAGERPNVHIIEGDSNVVVPNEVIPKIRYRQFRRGLCFLDPYGLDLDWKVLEGAGQGRSVEVLINFPIHDMNRNVLRHAPEKVRQKDLQRMNRFWGDDSWREVAYASILTLFGKKQVKASVERLLQAFSERLKAVAGFGYVAEPLLFRNSRGVPMYYLFFGSHKAVAAKIVNDIFGKHRERRA